MPKSANPNDPPKPSTGTAREPVLPVSPAVFLAVQVRPSNIDYVVLSVSIDGAVIDSRRVANTDYGCAVPPGLVGPAMGIRVTVAPLKKQPIEAFLYAWSSRAVDDPATLVDERWKQLGTPQAGDGKLEISGKFNGMTGQLA